MASALMAVHYTHWHLSLLFYWQGEDIQTMRVRATALLIGCSSGHLHPQGQFEATGIVHKFLLAGAPGKRVSFHIRCYCAYVRFGFVFWQLWSRTCGM
jgi:hypothetical protein